MEWKVTPQSMEAIAKGIVTPTEEQNEDYFSEILSPPLKRVRIDESGTYLPVLPAPPEVTSNCVPFAMEEEEIRFVQSPTMTGRGTRRLLRNYDHNWEDVVYRYQTRPETIPMHTEVKQLVQLLFPTYFGKVGKQNMAKFEITVLERTTAAVEQYSKQKKIFVDGLPNDIIGVSDDMFDILMSRFAVSMGCENLNLLTTYAELKYVDGELVTQDKRKFLSIIRHGLLPQLSSNECVRKLFTSYEKLLAIDQEMVIEHLLIPLIVNKGALIRILLQKLNTHLLLLKLLEHLVLNSILLSPPIMTTVGLLLDKESEYLSPPSSDYLFTLIKTATSYSMNVKLAAFYYSVVTKFADSMTEMELRQLYSLNFYNNTIYKALVEKMVDQHVKNIKRTKFFATTTGSPPLSQTISAEAMEQVEY